MYFILQARHKLDQFSQQNTHCRTAILQNSSLSAPTFLERKFILTNLDEDSRAIKMDKLAKITDMIFILDELDNTDNLEDGRPSNTLFTYHVAGSTNFLNLEPTTPNIGSSNMVICLFDPENNESKW